MNSHYLKKDLFGTPRNDAERAAHKWLTEHSGESGEPVMRSMADAMRDFSNADSRHADMLEAARAALKWADDLKPYADDGTSVVPVFERLRTAIAEANS